MFPSRQLDHQTPAMKSPAAAIDHPASAQPVLGLARSRIIRRTTKLLSYGALAAITGILLVVAAATLPVLFGYHTYVINGGSMEPALELGSVAITSPTNARGLEVGDIIAYRESPENPPVLHRIVQITTDATGQLAFLTQGDQNRTPDPRPAVLQGNGDRVVYTVPYAGYILNFAQSTLGRILLIAVPGIVLFATNVWPGRRARRPSRAQTQAAPADAPVQPPAVTAITERLRQAEAERREIAKSDLPPWAGFDSGRPATAPADASVRPPGLTAIAERLADAERREIAASGPPPRAPAWPSLEAQAEQRRPRPTRRRLSLEAQAVRLRLFQHPAVRRGT